MNATLTMLDLFSGIGGFAYAAEIANELHGDAIRIVSVAHSEVEPFACAVYHRHYPTSVCLGAVQNVCRDTLLERTGSATVDVVTGGFPCQPHSCAGKRQASADDRDLWSECARILRDIQPRYALFENVGGLLTSEHGLFFNRVLSDMAEAGYDCLWQAVPASAVGAPHRRERVWMLCVADGDGIGIQGQREQFRVAGEVGQGRQDSPQNRVAFIGWPSRPGEPQYGWEPPRVTHSKRRQTQPPLGSNPDGLPATVGGTGPEVHNRVAQLKGYGNAIVPQVAAIMLMAIMNHETKGEGQC